MDERLESSPPTPDSTLVLVCSAPVGEGRLPRMGKDALAASGIVVGILA
jgi:hypothetical protein